MTKYLLLACVFVVLLTAAQPAYADSIILRTGVNAALTPLGPNVADPFWTISVQGGAFVAAEVVNAEVICCSMETVAATARWISDPSVTAGSPNTGWGIGPTAIARRQFDLTGSNLSTVSLTGVWRVADNRLGVFLNGNLLAGTNTGSGFQTDQAVSVTAPSAFFVAGINTLELRGSSTNSQFDGFFFNGTVEGVTGPVPTPEPSSLALLSFGVAGLAAGSIRRWRR
jgi:hypothetical protein